MDFFVGGYLLVLSVEDVRYKKVSLWILIVSLVIAVCYSCAFSKDGIWFLNIVPGILLCILAAAVPKCLGLADGMLAIFYGILYGFRKTCLWMMIGLGLSAVCGVFWSIFKRRTHLQVPLIPFLAIAHMGICI